MAYPVPHHLLTIGGPLFSVEEWSMSLRLGDTIAPGTTVEEDQATCDAIAADLVTRWTDTAPFGSAAGLAYVKLNPVGTDGKYQRQVTVQKEVTPVKKNTRGIAYPAQVALVATLETGYTRGLAHRGRIFIPTPGGQVDPVTGTIGVTTAQSVADWVAAWIVSLNAHTNLGQVIVASKGSTLPGASPAGAFRPVTGVSVGTVLDTMRSRRGKILEGRASSEVTGVIAGGSF